jgi:2-oxoacid:acceptor oxidoreductase delta subunit (pyruvate/2-ketoisovalerate family)
MLNLECKREIKQRQNRQKEHGLPDLERLDIPLAQDEATYEASRCLGTTSCEACDLCRLLCPDLAITRDLVSGEIVIDLDYCKGCGICAAVCPKGAITMELEQEVE